MPKTQNPLSNEHRPLRLRPLRGRLRRHVRLPAAPPRQRPLRLALPDPPQRIIGVFASFFAFANPAPVFPASIAYFFFFFIIDILGEGGSGGGT